MTYRVQNNPQTRASVITELVRLNYGENNSDTEAYTTEVSADARFCPDTSETAPLLVILHGFKAFARWGFFPYFGEYFAEQGFLTITANFSLNGVPHRINPESTVFAEPERFARNTISQEVRDAEALLYAATRRTLGTGTAWNKSLQERWNGEIYLLAHSRGSATAWVVGERFPEVRKIAALGAIARLDRFTERAKVEWRKQGYFLAQTARAGQELRMNHIYLEDIALHAQELEPLHTIRRVRQPVLLVHGQQDLTVPVREAYQLFTTAQDVGCHVRWAAIPNASHTFGITHPMTIEQAQTPTFRQLCSQLEVFFYE